MITIKFSGVCDDDGEVYIIGTKAFVDVDGRARRRCDFRLQGELFATLEWGKGGGDGGDGGFESVIEGGVAEAMTKWVLKRTIVELVGSSRVAKLVIWT